MCERVLIVDDYESWRRMISASLRKDERWQVIETAADGLEAVRKAETLRPDLILMDVELPGLDGVEAARRILAKQPDARILFVSAHRSADIVEAAIGTGARGYVLKAEVARDLPVGVNVVVKGERYISPRLLGRSTDARAAVPHASHEAALYADASAMVEGYVTFAEQSLNAGRVTVVVATPDHLTTIRDGLRRRGIDIDSAAEHRRYLTATVDELLSSFMVSDWPDERLFWKAASGMVVRAAAAFPRQAIRIAACGEGAGSLLARGHVEAAIRLEHLWAQAVKAFGLDVFCGYCMDAYTADPAVLQRLEQEHSAVCSG